MKFVCVGDCGTDRYGDDVRPGGCTLNVAVRLKRAGMDDVNVVTAIGDDAESAVVLAAMAAEGLSAGLVAQVPGRTPQQSIRVRADGEKTFVGYEAGVLPDHVLNAEARAAIAAADCVVTVVYEQITEFFERVIALPRRGKLCIDFMDLSDFEGSLARIAPALAVADLAVFGLSSRDGTLLAGISAWALATGKMALVTLGADGSVAFAGHNVFRCAPVHAHDVVDTTGAGDVYLATFLAASAKGESIEGAMSAASAAATAKLALRGAF